MDSKRHTAVPEGFGTAVRVIVLEVGDRAGRPLRTARRASPTDQ